MTSRVQKGSTVFRPVAKSRPRTAQTASRQTSLAVEGSISLPSTDVSLPFQLSSSSSEPVTQNGGTFNPEDTTTSLAGVTDGSTTTNDGYTVPTPSVPSHRPVLPLAIGSSSLSGSRSRSTVPTVIASPRSSQAPAHKVKTQTTDHGSTPNIIPPLKLRLPAAFTPAATIPTVSTIITADDDSTGSATEPFGPAFVSTASISTPDPSSGEYSTKATTRKRKTSTKAQKEFKKRSNTTDTDDVDNTLEGSSSKKGRSRASSRAASGTPKPRRRAPTPVYDPDADPGEDLDPTSVTMAELCSDTGQGRVSSKAAEILNNHATWKAKNREKRARMRTIMEAKKHGREAELEDERQDGQEILPAGSMGEASSSNAAIADDTGNGFDYSQDLTTSRFNVQVRIGPNGETVIDEESLVVDRAENDGTENYTHVIESDQTKFVNSGSYGKKYRGSRWSAEETDLFYDALSQYGENYELIAFVLPGRDRKSCKNKFKVEDKRNPARINYCLNNSIPVDMQTLSRMTGKDFSGPVPEIRAPTPLPPPPEGDFTGAPTEPISPRIKKRSRSRSRGVNDSGVVVLGDAETFEG